MGKKKKKQKPPKEKIVYIDDNSTVADMRPIGKEGRPIDLPQKSSFRESMRTYFSAVKMMLIPCLVVLGAFVLVYIILRLATGQ